MPWLLVHCPLFITGCTLTALHILLYLTLVVPWLFVHCPLLISGYTDKCLHKVPLLITGYALTVHFLLITGDVLTPCPLSSTYHWRCPDSLYIFLYLSLVILINACINWLCRNCVYIFLYLSLVILWLLVHCPLLITGDVLTACTLSTTYHWLCPDCLYIALYLSLVMSWLFVFFSLI